MSVYFYFLRKCYLYLVRGFDLIKARRTRFMNDGIWRHFNHVVISAIFKCMLIFYSVDAGLFLKLGYYVFFFLNIKIETSLTS